MKCPLLAIGYLSIGDQALDEKCECLKEECAVWDRDLEQCSEVTKAKALDRLERVMTDILEKMPGASQFTK